MPDAQKGREGMMTKHSITELRRQYVAAMGVRVQAEKKEIAALRQLTDALIAEAEAEYAARGIVPGTVVQSPAYTLGGRPMVGVYVGHEVGTFPDWASPVVMKRKADGSAHATAKMWGGYNWEPLK